MAKKLMLTLAVAVAGIGVGGGSAYATAMLMGPPPAPSDAPVPDETALVPAGKVLAPLVFPDGRLSGYVSFELSIEVAADRSEEIAARMPILLNAINMRTYRTPMTSGREGMLPDLAVFRKLVVEAGDEAFGKGSVKRAAISQAVPA